VASRKVDFALSVRAAVTAFVGVVERLNELNEIYADSGYDSGGINPIADSDLEEHDITVQNLADTSVLADNVVLFLNAGTPLKLDYQSTINKFRGMS